MSHRKKVALIAPGTSARFAVQEPLNLGYLASYLEANGCEVKIIDQLAGDSVTAELTSFRPDVAGVTATTPLAYEAYRIAEQTKKAGILTVIGGVHASIFPEEAIEHADIVVKGEGERALLEIVQGDITSGIVSRPFVENLDDIPIPARHLMKMDRYLYCKKRIPYISHLPYVSPRKRIVHILTSRGCMHGDCIYCHNTWRNMPFRSNSPQRIISEIESLKSAYDIQAIYYIEDCFFADRDRVVELCSMKLSRGLDDIVWGGSSRVDDIDPDILKIAKRAGCREISIGVESGSQRILDRLDKGVDVEQARWAVQQVKDAGIIPHINFIIGNPDETRADLEKTQQFIKQLKLDSISVYLFTPYPGSRAWRDFRKDGLVSESMDWRRFTQESILVNTTEASDEELEKLRARLLLRASLRNPKELAKVLFWSTLYPRAFVGKMRQTISPWIGNS